MKCEIGDVLQIDGGHVIVTEVKGDRASIAALGDLKGRSAHALKHGIEPNISNNRLVERRGVQGLAEFINARAQELEAAKKGLIKLEPGDNLCYEGAICIVYDVTPKQARIAHPDGRLFTEDRLVNEFFLQCGCHKLERLTTEQRAANLRAHNERRAVKPEPKPVKEKKPAAPGAFTGRAAFTRQLATNLKLSVEEIHQKAKAVYPGASLSTTKKLVASERGVK